MPRGTPLAYRQRAADEAHRINERNRRYAQKALDRARAALSRRQRTLHTEVITGEVAPELMRLARELPAGLVVVGSRKPQPVRHYLLGSTAEKLVRHSPASVLVVR